MLNGVDGIDFDVLNELFDTDAGSGSLPTNEGTTQKPVEDGAGETTPTTDPSQIDNTKAFSERLKERSEKVRLEERARIAKELGYESYAELIKERENKLLADKGLTPEEVSPIVDELVNKRLNDDPRMQELSELRKARTKEFAEQELAKLNKLTDGAITSLNQIPKDVIDEWTKTGSLTKSYMKLHGEELIAKVKSGQSNGSTSHLKTPGAGSNLDSNKRPLTNDEIKIWKAFNPRMTDEELAKIMVEK